MAHPLSFKETRTTEFVNIENDPPEEIIPLSDLDCVYLKIYVPITSTYKIEDEVPRQLVVANLCEGFRKTINEYRFLGGYIQADSKGKFYVSRSAAHATLPIHIKHLEHTDFPTYEELEQRGFPFSELNERHLPPDFALPADPTTKPGEGFPTVMIQLNFIRGGIIIGTAIHHQCVDVKGVDLVMARWAANTRSLFTGDAPPSFDPSCLDPTPFCSTTPLAVDQIPDVKSKIKSFEYMPIPPETKVQPVELSQTIFHFPTSRLTQLKASAIFHEADQWVSTNDCITALMWRAMTRARLPHCNDPAQRVHMHQAVDIRAYNDPPMHPAYPGNTVSISYVESTVERLLSSDTFASVAQDVRATVKKWRSPSMIKDTKDYLASFPNRNGVKMKLTFSPGLSTTVSSWSLMTAYQTHDFGFGPLSALRCATGALNKTFVVYARRPNTGNPDEGIEVFAMLEKGEAERLREDPELRKWAEVRAC